MSLLDIFKGAPATTVTPAGTQTQQSEQTQQTQQLEPAGALDGFKNLWENDPNKSADPSAFAFNLTPEHLSTITSQMDFSSLATDELKARIAAGGEDAVKATMELQNATARQLYTHSAMTSAKLIETAIEQTKAGMNSVIDQKIKALGLAESVATLNPALTNPAVAPLVQLVQQKIQEKYPSATQAELASKTNEYFNKVGAAFNPEMATRANAPTNKFGISNQSETDWATEFGIKLS